MPNSFKRLAWQGDSGADKVREAVHEQAKKFPNVALSMGPQGFSDEAIYIYLDKATKSEILVGHPMHYQIQPDTCTAEILACHQTAMGV